LNINIHLKNGNIADLKIVNLIWPNASTHPCPYCDAFSNNNLQVCGNSRTVI